MGFSFFRKKEDSNNLNKTALVIDIGSASVTAAIVMFENSVSTVVASVSTDIAILPDLVYDRFEKEMLKALDTTLNKILRSTFAKLDRINVCLASPWYASQVRVAKLARLAPFVASKSVLDDMIRRELKAFEEEEIKTKNLSGDAVRSIETQTIRARLNGYDTHEPLGVSAKELELTIFLSIASEPTLKNIEETISRVYTAPVVFSTFLSMTYLVSRDYFPHQQNYMLIDIGAEVSDISLVKENGLQQSFSFPCGRNMIVRRLADGLKRSLEESQSLWDMHVEGKTSGQVGEDTGRILTAVKNEWQTEFQKALYAASKDLAIPDVILLTVDDDIAFWFSDAIKNEQFHQNTLADKEFKIYFMNSSLFHDALVFAEKVPRNVAIMIEALGMKHLFSHNM